MLLFRDLQYYFFFLLFSYLEKFLGIGKDSLENVQKLQVNEGLDFTVDHNNEFNESHIG